MAGPQAGYGLAPPHLERSHRKYLLIALDTVDTGSYLDVKTYLHLGDVDAWGMEERVGRARG